MSWNLFASKRMQFIRACGTENCSFARLPLAVNSSHRARSSVVTGARLSVSEQQRNMVKQILGDLLKRWIIVVVLEVR